MAYSAKARELRKCTGTKKNGEPCRAFATWDSNDHQLCVVHLGRHHTGPMLSRLTLSKPANYPPCTCQAYNWPHRPGGGLCNWPDVPTYRLTTPRGTKSYGRRLISLGRELQWAKRAKEEREFWEELERESEAARQEAERAREYEELKKRYGEEMAAFFKEAEGF